METKYLRHYSTIYVCSDHSLSPELDNDGNAVVYKAFKSINQAKRESHKLQKANGGLGRGFVAII